MIARVALDSEALLDFEKEPRRAANVQADLVEVLLDYGYLEHLGDNDKVALEDAYGRLRPDLNELWDQAMKDMASLNRIMLGDDAAAMRDLCAGERLPARLNDRLDLVVIRQSLAAVRGVDINTGHAKRGNEPEIALSDTVRQSSTVKGLHDQREHGGAYEKGEERESVWEDLLVHAARLSVDATILDRYFLTHLLQPKGKRRRDHHEWLLAKLDQSMLPGATLRVISELPTIGRGRDGSPPPRMSPDDAVSRIESGLAPLVGGGRIGQLKIVLAPWPERREGGPHNRHVRFSCGVALCTYEGFDYLDKPELVAKFTWQAATSAKRIAQLAADEQVILRDEERLDVPLPKQAEGSAGEVDAGPQQIAPTEAADPMPPPDASDVAVEGESGSPEHRKPSQRGAPPRSATREDAWERFVRTHHVGQIVEVRVRNLVPFGAFVRVAPGIRDGLVHISELADRYVRAPEEVVAINQKIDAVIIDIDPRKKEISLSLKQVNKSGPDA